MKRDIELTISCRRQSTGKKLTGWSSDELKVYRDLAACGPRDCMLDTKEKIEQEVRRLEADLRDELVKILAEPRSMRRVARELVVRAASSKNKKVGFNEKDREEIPDFEW